MSDSARSLDRSPGGYAGDSDAMAFSLLRAAPFSISGDGAMTWPVPALPMALLRCYDDDLPKDTKAYNQWLDPATVRERLRAIQSLTWDGAQYGLTYRVRTFDGRELWIKERGQRLRGVDKVATEISAVIEDVDTQEKDRQQAVYRASFDELTGIWNEQRLREALNYMFKLKVRYDFPSAFLRLRVTNLADVNTHYGFEAGDRLLSAIAARLKAHIRAPDVIGRIGSVSFGLGLTDCSPDGMAAFSQRIISILSDTPYPGPHGDLYAEFSSSGTPFVIAGNSGAKNADDALAQTRSALGDGQDSPGQFVSFDPHRIEDASTSRPGKITADVIVAALNERRISLAYQPIIDAKTRDLHHYECLLRLRRDDGEIVSAGQFIMAAEKLDLVHLLDRRALEMAAETLRRDPSLRLALNVSAGTVKNPEAADAYLAALRGLGPMMNQVILELTETVALDDPAMASRFSVEARMMGAEFAIDDFGSGYTTFQNLMAIEADTIKIDGSFVQDLAITPHKQTFVRMMVDLAQTFSVSTVAEMVDNREDADLLTRLGVDYLQGYYFGIPSAAPMWQRKSA